MRKIFSFLAMAAVVLMMASCNEDPDPEVQPDGTSFQFVVKNTTIDQADVLVVPPTLQTEFFWAYATEEHLNKHGLSLLQFVQTYLKLNTYDGLKEGGRIVSGKKIIQITSLLESTDYRLVVCEIDPDLNVIGKPASVPFKTIKYMPSKGLLSGVFTVDDKGKQVRFSQGSLQFQASTGTWQFAEHQYDHLGNAANVAISPTNTGWIDLFGWNTANNPTLATDVVDDYAGEFVDWGSKPISNGGKRANVWRTLTQEQWVYVMHGRANAEQLVGMGHINLDKDGTDYVNGFFLLPDDWQLPAGMTFNSCVSRGMNWSDTYLKYTGSNAYSHNAYSLTEWEAMERAGAVFFPSSGFRHFSTKNGHVVDQFNRGGFYWTSSYYTDDIKIYHIGVGDVQLTPSNYGSKPLGMHVRLVWDLE